MERIDFLEEIFAIENKLSSKVKDESGRLGFMALLKRALELGLLDKQTVDDLKKLWETRNKVVFPQSSDYTIPSDIQDVLLRTINNPKLQ